MKATIHLATLLLPLLAVVAPPAQAQDSNVKSDGTMLWDSCGGEDEPACLPGSPAYNYILTYASAKCDFTLDPTFEGGRWMCRDKGRRRSIPDLAYTQSRAPIEKSTFFQQSDQLGRISADLPINYVPIIGTHNSYSNPHDGGNNGFNVDQLLTITDQLQMGARHIRLDPMAKVQNGTPVVCHISPMSDSLSKFMNAMGLPSNERELCNTSLFGKPLSFQRPFFYAVRELRRWLDRHPGEVVILRLNFVGESVSELDMEAVLEHELAGLLLKKSGDGTLPTLRQIRAAGKQVIALTSKYSFSPYVISTAGSLSNTWSNSTAHPMFPICQSSTGNPIGLQQVRTYGLNPVWPNIGEDRSASMAYASDIEKGMLGLMETEIAVQCGYSMIGFDYFHALQYAPKGEMPFAGKFDFSGPSPDPRPQAAVWSWRYGTALDSPMPAALSKPVVMVPMYPARLTDYRNIRWEAIAENTALPFACAGPADAQNPRRYEWRITTTSGPWTAGETECQKLGAAYHFWRPMSGIENAQLVEVFKGIGAQRVWLNHYSGRTVALPSSSVFDYPGATDATLGTIVMSSGIGGGFKLSFQPGVGGKNFLDVPATTASPVIRLKANTAVAGTLAPGSYTGILTIEESAGNLKGVAQVQITLRVK